MQTITIYHSPDADDAFMFHGLVSGAVKVPGFDFKHDLSDIETLNQRTMRGELEVTAVSVHAYAYLAHLYDVTSCGASMGGESYGPKLISKHGTLPSAPRIAIPGELTSACLALKIWLAENNIKATLVPVYFDKIPAAILEGSVDAGVIIHEGQLTYQAQGFTQLVDFGNWWWKKYQLPLPLGINVVKKSLSNETKKAVAQALHGSITYALAHRDEALEYALSYGRGLKKSDADTFVGMYVNELTVNFGDAGRRSMELFLKQGAEVAGIPEVEGLPIVTP